MSEPLATYLQDHLAGARTAIELLQAMRDRKDDFSLKEFAEHLLPDVEADRDLLQAITEEVGTGSNVVKEITGWLGEKATRVKLGQNDEDEFGDFQALEFLALGVLGKVALWDALHVVAALDARLRRYDFKQLAGSAQVQHETVEHQRLESARRAFAPRTG